MKYKTWLKIDSSSIIYNLKEARNLINNKTKLMAVVKSNAYGHGILEISKLAVSESIDWLGVDSLEEALLIRESGIKTPILVLGYIVKENLKKVIENDISIVAYNKETLAELSKLKKPAKIHIKVETGTMRQGVFLEDLEEFIRYAKKSPNITIEGIYTHFANIEDTTDHGFAKEQLHKFNQALQVAKELKIKPLAHTACSAALILFSETHFDMVRFGISMYGYWSSPQTFVSSREKKGNVEFKTALSWKSVIAQIKNVKSGTPVGYGLMEKTNQDTKIAIVPVGYWDGYDRKLSSIGNVLIGGKRCKIVGRICMNMFMVDINHLPDVKVEDEVVLIGQQGEENITVEELAQKVGTINYEIITRIYI
jgi:alanine racemase